MVSWMIWIIFGVVCVIIEIFTPGFLFMSIGIGAIATGLISRLGIGIPLQFLIFAVITFVIFISTRKWSSRILAKSKEPTNIDALKGRSGKVVQEIPSSGRGYVKIGGEEWSAVSQDDKKIEKDENIIVVKVEGNKLIVLPANQKQDTVKLEEK